MFRFVIVLALVALSSAQFGRQSQFRSGSYTGTRRVQTQTFQPVQQRRYEIIPILRFNQQGPENGAYSFDFETGNGIVRSEQGQQGANGGANKQGSFSYTLPDGTPAEFSFVANENGYQVQSNLLPVAPPMPAHALEQIAKAERERAAGIIHDGSYDHARYGGSPSTTQNVRQTYRRRFSF